MFSENKVLYIYYTILILKNNGLFTGKLNKCEPRFTRASGGPAWEARDMAFSREAGDRR